MVILLIGESAIMRQIHEADRQVQLAIRRHIRQRSATNKKVTTEKIDYKYCKNSRQGNWQQWFTNSGIILTLHLEYFYHIPKYYVEILKRVNRSRYWRGQAVQIKVQRNNGWPCRTLTVDLTVTSAKLRYRCSSHWGAFLRSVRAKCLCTSLSSLNLIQVFSNFCCLILQK